MAKEPDPRPYGRRAFLGLVAGGLSALFWAQPAWHRAREVLRTAGSILPSELADLVPSRGWRIYTVASTMPVFDAAKWRLRIDGLVERPLTISYEELLALPHAEQVSTFHCVTGWTVEGVHWKGVRFRDLLAPAEPRPEARALRFVSAEKPYQDSLTLEQALLPDAMLAYEMDGQSLTRPHGAPVRVVLPEMYGYKNVKWVNRIELTAKAVDGYWEGLGYDRDAWVGHSNGYG
jgi:DMSO/TMAO reductase YedYZ molybdopterin-dependent catalytic subunit